MMPVNDDFSSDLAVLNERCLKNQIPSPIKFTQSGKPCIENKIHIDLYEVFRKELIKGTIFKNKYRTLKLEDVSHSLLGKGKYGSGAISGANVHTFSIDEQKQYVLQDAQLVMDLSKTNKGQIMSLMQAIAELTGLSLEHVCHSSLSTWWTKVFDDMGCIPSQLSGQDDEARNQPTDYQGGLVIEPNRGLYRNLKVVDVVSLYPSVAILYNISFDTVNCVCCINKEDARVPADVIDKGYWICKQREGAFPKKLRQFKEERIREKQLGNEERQLGLKILINGGYGLFGNPAFKYADIRVAELITAFGRHTLLQMQDIASKRRFTIVAGDTDSLFLDGGSNNIDRAIVEHFIAECKERIGVDVEHSQTFVKAAIIKKKHYFGVTTEGEIKVVGMEGKKNDRPPWIRKVFDQFLEDFKAERDPIVNLNAAMRDLESGKIDPELLKIKVKLAKDPADYAVNNINKKIGMLLGAKAGDVISYFKTHDKKGGVTINPEEIGIHKYKEMLMATVKDALEILSTKQREMQSETKWPNQDSSGFHLHDAQIPQCHPFVKWAGGKTQLLPELEKYIPENFTHFFEPFLGGGAFFFYLVSSKQLKFTAYLSDTNKELINAYKVVKYNVEELIELLKDHENGYNANPNEYYYKLRDTQFKLLTDIESAARFITLNKTCYNGLYRVNRDGLFNVPIGKFKKSPLICDTKNLRNVSTALRHTNANLFVDNYQEILELAKENDFIYLDPPYKPTSITANFTSYTRDGFGDKDQITLHETFKKLHRKGCKILLSNSDTPFVRELYSDFNQYTSQVSSLRAINSKATRRTGHMELLVRNFEK